MYYVGARTVKILTDDIHSVLALLLLAPRP